MEIDCGYTVCKFQQKRVSDNMGLVGLAVMATGFYHLLAYSQVMFVGRIIEEIPISEVL